MQATRLAGVLPLCRDAVTLFYTRSYRGGNWFLKFDRILKYVSTNPQHGQDATNGQFLSGV